MGKLQLITSILMLFHVDMYSAGHLPEVNLTGLGSLTGYWGKTMWTMQSYMIFESIAYTEPTERFQLPSPKKSFEHPNAWNYGCSTLKDMSNDDFSYSADSFNQFLSIYTKSLNDKSAVMVYISGHDLDYSCSREDNPRYLIEEDIVLVTVRYRSGPFGFLSTLSDDIPGNVGVFDVIEALRFIKKYISFFGGDEENITVFGHYKAAGLIHLITMTEIFKREKLFNKMILQSGSALLDGLSTDDPLSVAEGIAERLKCNDTSEAEALNECLKSAPTNELATAYLKFKADNMNFPHITIGGPSKLLEDPISEVAEYAEFDGDAVMGGFVKHPAVGANIPDDYLGTSLLIKAFSGMILEKSAPSYKDIIMDKFPMDTFEEVFENSLWPATVDLTSLDIKEATSKALKYISANDIKTYLYTFNYQGAQHNLRNIEPNDEFGTVAMTDDHFYLFPTEEKLNKQDTRMVKIMTKLWTSFAIDSYPNALNYVDTWPPVIKETMGPYLKIDKTMEVGWNIPEEFFTTVLETKHLIENL